MPAGRSAVTITAATLRLASVLLRTLMPMRSSIAPSACWVNGGRAMEDMMRQGLIGAVLDFSTIEVSNEMHHALLAGGPDRLTVAGALGLPQVLCPGALEVLVFNEPETVPARYAGRRLVRHRPKITDLRLTREEMAEVGREVARRLQATRRPAVFLIPNAGYDSFAVAGEPFHDLEADAAFVAELRKNAPRNVRIEERDLDINIRPSRLRPP